jgi:hypothetical protein
MKQKIHPDLSPLRKAEDAVLKIFKELPQCKASQLFDISSERGLFSDPFVLDKFTRRGGIAFCRGVMKRRDPNGLPYGKPCSSARDPYWKQLPLFTCEEWIDLLNREYTAFDFDFEEFGRLYTNACDLHGDRIPKFPLYELWLEQKKRLFGGPDGGRT